jgi:hypothetical protein
MTMLNILNRKRKTQIGDPKVLFYFDAVTAGSHGKIRVSHRNTVSWRTL